MPKRTPKRPSPPPELEVGLQQLIEVTFEDFAAFIRSNLLEPEPTIRRKLLDLLESDPDLLQAIFASGVVAGVESMTDMFQQAADLAQAQHQAQYHGRPVGRA